VKKVVLKMERPMPLGYSAAGIVEQVGEDARGLQVGDRVAMTGSCPTGPSSPSRRAFCTGTSKPPIQIF
jgi:NADPH:quinone reductase-like Zn-dependent oxidoreductase